mgnify:CR=1 FL=1
MTHWKHDIKNYSVLTNDKLDFILKESKDRLKSSIECSESLDRKSIFIAGYFIATITATTAYIFSKYSYLINFQKNLVLLIPVIFYLISNLLLICLVLRKVMPLSYYPLGNEPAKLLKQEICNQDFKKIITAYLTTLQRQITDNSADNQNKAKTIKLCINLAVFALIISIVIFLIMTCFIGF